MNYKLKDRDKRGRPDILHQFLLFTLGSLACKNDRLKVFIHTLFNQTFEVKKDVRIPRNYLRFIGLMEQLLVKGQVPPKGTPLISMKKQPLEELITEIKPTRVILLSEKGKLVNIKEYLETLKDIREKNYMFFCFDYLDYCIKFVC